MLLPRFLTALVGVPLLIVSIWWGSIPYIVLIFGIVVFALYEYYNLLEVGSIPVFKSLGLCCGTFFFVGILILETSLIPVDNAPIKSNLLPFILAVILVALALFSFFSRDKKNAFLGLAMMWFGNFYVVWSLAHLILLRDLKPNGRPYTFFLFFVIWALDIGAYLGGVKFGRRRMAEYISPKKSWEGALVGSLFALGAAIVSQISFSNFLDLKLTLILAGVIIVAAQISDLSESLLKRGVGVKDSGTLLPGHGGILDRFDSFLLTTPLYYYLLIFLTAGK